MTDSKKYFEDAKKSLQDIMVKRAFDEFQAKYAAEEQAKLHSRSRRNDGLNQDSLSDETDSKGNRLPYSQLLDKAVKDALNPKMNSMITWQTAMTDLLHLFDTVLKTIHPKAGQLHYAMRDAARDYMYEPIRNKIRDKMNSNPEVELPKLVHNVNFKDGKLTIDPLISEKDGKPMPTTDKYAQPTNALNAFFRKGVESWLEENGYKPDPSDNGVFKNGSTVLTEEAFKTLKDDPAHGLAEFLSRNSDLEYTAKLSN